VKAFSTPPFSAGDKDPTDQRWSWWPLLPLYPYGQRPTLVRQLLPGQLWSFEQLHGVWYVAVPIRMTVLRLREGLLLYAPVPPTGEVLAALRELERMHGPVCTIVLPTTSGLEHKLPVPAMARAFPAAEVWVTPHQWSFPLRLPSRWLGFPVGRTRVLFQDGVPHADQLDWLPLGPLDLGLGTFMEVACYHRVSGSLLVTDALVSIPAEPPAVFDLDPTPLLFHARERGEEPLSDTPENRRRGWKRIVLFANYLRPEPLDIATIGNILTTCLAPGCRDFRSHFGIYPFSWRQEWEAAADALLSTEASPLQVAPVLEGLVFPRCRHVLLEWMSSLLSLRDIRWLIAAHYSAPSPTTSEKLGCLIQEVGSKPWAQKTGSWQTLARIDEALLAFGFVPVNPLPPGVN
jgi:hypothetical protein